MLGRKMQENKVNVWMVNTGWTGGPYGVGHRMKLKYTRAMVSAALEGKLDKVNFHQHEVFGTEIPMDCPGVPADVLDPRSTWDDPKAYDEKARYLASLFIKNFEKYASGVSPEILAAAPRM
jgi:phosphoenolpyruvate carboxykinase (ATP)